MSEPEDAHDFPIHPGDKIGPYLVESFLARGGMGVLLRGLDTMLDRPVAIKVIDPRLADTGDFRARFERECKILAKLRHPHVVMIYYFGKWEGAPFYAMELVEGSNLDEHVSAHGAAEWRQAVQWMIESCGALDAAREAGVIHRDLKPANILLDEAGTIRVVDFGLAKSMASSKHLTMASMVVGTPHYMSPEQAKGLELDWRSDLYSLGATFFHVLTGRTLFDAPSAMEVVSHHISTPPPQLASCREGLPVVLCRLIDQILAKDPEDRGFASYGEVAGVLERFLEIPADPAAATLVESIPPASSTPPGATQQVERATDSGGPRATVAIVDPAGETSVAGGEAAPNPSAATMVAGGSDDPGAAPVFAWLERGTDEGDRSGAMDVALIRDGEVRFGTHESNAILVQFAKRSPGRKLISGRHGHGAFVWTPTGWQLRPLRNKRTGLLNEVSIGGKVLPLQDHPVGPGTEIDLRGQASFFLAGSFENGLRVTFDTHDEVTRADPGYQEWATVLFHDRVLIGSAESAGIRLGRDCPEELLHLFVEDERFQVTTLAAGAFLDGKPCEGNHQLNDGEILEGPGFRYRFRQVPRASALW